MNTDNWQYYHKLNFNGDAVESNLLYTPTISPKGDIMCMHFCIDKKYRSNTPDSLTQDLVDWFFDREIRFLNSLSHLKCTPTLYDVDEKNKKLFIEFNKETLSQILFDKKRNIDEEIPDWEEQIFNIIEEFTEAEHYKLSLYPHCFFLSRDNKIKTIDYYPVIPYSEPFIERKIIEGVIGRGGAYRFDESTKDGYIDFRKFYDITITRHLDQYWPRNPFK
jgi:hypothetical protein